jgi:hypothetical protein
MVVNARCRQILEERGFIGKDMGQLGYDAPGRIVRAVFLAPKEYLFEYIEEGTRKLKVVKRAKGIPVVNREKMNFERMERMLESDMLPDSQRMVDNVKMKRMNKTNYKVGVSAAEEGRSHFTINNVKVPRVVNGKRYTARDTIVTKSNNLHTKEWMTVPKGFRLNPNGRFAIMEQAEPADGEQDDINLEVQEFEDSDDSDTE